MQQPQALAQERRQVELRELLMFRVAPERRSLTLVSRELWLPLLMSLPAKHPWPFLKEATVLRWRAA